MRLLRVNLFILALVIALAFAAEAKNIEPASFGEDTSSDDGSGVLGGIVAIFFVIVYFAIWLFFMCWPILILIVVLLIGVIWEVFWLVMLIRSFRGKYSKQTTIPYGIICLMLFPFVSAAGIGFILFLVGIVLIILGCTQIGPKKEAEKRAAEMSTANPYAPQQGYGYAPNAMPQGYPPQGYPPQGYPPQGYPPQPGYGQAPMMPPGQQYSQPAYGQAGNDQNGYGQPGFGQPDSGPE
ncbi:hypothetical protein J8273_0624 [Carpediemonas membranifera]|uniref:Rhodopsin n=1 Tax=Carpediemonas membranifera TaxID=201153 RepID=A0A8J6E2D7_9EUKA|nr:hypothetical protein J8273_0624 [Carpediemonas membranifera]|eukprot:KAG9397494.1 hypothetical protein J8273_0624 [Carpediemonas membranifera]